MSREVPRVARVSLAAAALVLVLALAPTGAAGSHGGADDDGDATVEILREPAGEPVRAGAPTAFTWLLLDGDGKPFVHHDAVFEVRWNGTTLLETTPETGHDYDGIDTYRVVFPGPGTYTARVEVMDGDGGVLVEERVTGEVLPAPDRSPDAFLEAPEEATVGEEVQLAYGLGSGDDPVEATDVRLRVLRAEDGFLEAELDTSAPDGLHEATYRFDEAGTYELRVAGAGTGEAATEAAAASTTLTVEPAPEPPAEGPPTRRPLENTVDRGEADDGYELYGTYDPYTSIGPHGRLRLGAVVMDPATSSPARGVDYSATLVAPDGTERLQVDDLREDDGILTVVVSPSTVGDHLLEVQAEAGSWSGSVSLEFSVHPPAGALGAGPQFTTLDSPDEARSRVPGTFAFEVSDAAGVPLPHSEVDFRALDPSGVPVLAGKLHGHNDGRFPVDLALPEAGAYDLAGSPETLQPAPTPYYYGPDVGTRPAFELAVEPGEPVERASGSGGAATAGDEGAGALGAPLGPAAALAGLALAGLAGRRRR